jgi:hypothetical protein
MHVMVDFRFARRVGCCDWHRGRVAATARLWAKKGNDAMVEQIEPTMEEIVVALRETRRGAGRGPPLTVVRDRGMADWTPNAAPSNENRGTGRGHIGAADTHNDIASAGIAGLRDAEIERLLAENARCNERIMFLLKVIEHGQASNTATVAQTVALEMDRGAILRDVKASLDAELRPVLLVLQRLLEKQQLRHAGGGVRSPARKPPAPAAPVEPSGWIADMGRELDRGGRALEWRTSPAPADVIQLPNLRQRMARAFDALYAWTGTETSLPARSRRISNDL